MNVFTNEGIEQEPSGSCPVCEELIVGCPIAPIVIVVSDILPRVPTARQVYDACAWACGQDTREYQIGEQEGAKVIYGEFVFNAVDGFIVSAAPFDY